MLKPINIVVAVLSVAVICLGYIVLFQDSNGQQSVEEHREQPKWNVSFKLDGEKDSSPSSGDMEFNCMSAGGRWDMMNGICTWN